MFYKLYSGRYIHTFNFINTFHDLLRHIYKAQIPIWDVQNRPCQLMLPDSSSKFVFVLKGQEYDILVFKVLCLSGQSISIPNQGKGGVSEHSRAKKKLRLMHFYMAESERQN